MIQLKYFFFRTFFISTIATLPLVSLAWGYQGHYKISYSASLSFTGDMAPFNAWTATLAEYASFADDRKGWDPSESVRHYIDIDNYQVFLNTGRIPQTIDSLIYIYGWPFVHSQGILPWATLTTYDSLVSCFLRNDLSKAVFFAADLGHYVGDGHMPLHITRNYNGQYTGNSGIHSRFESTMINNFLSQIIYEGEPVQVISNVNEYVFEYLYQNYTYVDSVIAADDYAQSISGNFYSSAYQSALWQKSKSFTTILFKNASHSLAELIYTAWVEAGSPSLSSASASESLVTASFQLKSYPNPVKDKTTIAYQLNADEHVTITLSDVTGQYFQMIYQGFQHEGSYSMEFSPDNLEQGVYLLNLTAGKQIEVSKMVIDR